MRTINLEIELPLLSSEVSTLLQDIVDKVNHDKNQEQIQKSINDEVKLKLDEQMSEAFEKVVRQIKAIGVDSSLNISNSAYSIKIGERYNLGLYKHYGSIQDSVVCDKPIINSMWLSFSNSRAVDTKINKPLEEQIINTLKDYIYDELKRS